MSRHSLAIFSSANTYERTVHPTTPHRARDPFESSKLKHLDNSESVRDDFTPDCLSASHLEVEDSRPIQTGAVNGPVLRSAKIPRLQRETDGPRAQGHLKERAKLRQGFRFQWRSPCHSTRSMDHYGGLHRQWQVRYHRKEPSTL